MLYTLYKCFQHWSEKGSVFVFSDTHFSDSDCKLMDPGWITPEEQVNIINKLVHKNDTLILLGDVGTIDWVKKLKAGYKVLITGNHDSGVENYQRKRWVISKPFSEKGFTAFSQEYTTLYGPFDNPSDYAACNTYYQKEVITPKIKEFAKTVPDFVSAIYEYSVIDDEWQWKISCDNRLFDEVYAGPLMISDKIILSHEPIPNINWALNIHGHNHSVAARMTNTLDGVQYVSTDLTDIYHFSVCSNVINYVPINLKDVINTGALKMVDSLHRITIDTASEHPLHKKDWHYGL